MPLITIYLMFLALINLITLGAFVVDKLAAKAQTRRIPERVLQGLMLGGGVIGGLIGIAVVRHKSQHLSFQIVLVVALVLHVTLAFWLFSPATT